MNRNPDSDADIGDNSLQTVDVDIGDEQSLAKIVELHMELLDFGPMAGLGPRFIRDIGYKLHMADGLLKVALCRVAGQPAGFVAYTAQSKDFHRKSLSAHWPVVCWVLFLSLVEKPSRLTKLVRALKTVASRRKEKKRDIDSAGEIVAIAAKRKFLGNEFVDEEGRRVSVSLVAYGQHRLQKMGVRKLRMLVDADNRGALFLYHGLGARMNSYEQAGEPMVEVWLDSTGHCDKRDVPTCWLENVNSSGQSSDWGDYWERLNNKQPIFELEARDYVSRLRKMIGPIDQSRVLDFGCGFGIVSEVLAPYVGTLALWDSAANMRKWAYSRVVSLENVQFLDLSRENQDLSAGRFDLILVNSVVQYMSTEQLDHWLARWKTLLEPGGKLVISDIIGPDYSFVRDLLALMRISSKSGVLLRSIWAGLKEIGEYRSVKASRPLLSLDPTSISAAATRAGLAVEILPANLTYHAGRLTAVFRNSGR